MSKSTKKMMEGESSEMDMTPMIDIVFNLLIFFMVVTDLQQKDLADLTLPLAYKAMEDKDNDVDDRVIVNVDKHGVIHFKGKATPLGELRAALILAKDAYNSKKGGEGVEKVAGAAGDVSKLFVLLRADRDTPWQHVQYLMTIMAEAKLYKMQFATKKFADHKYKPEEKAILGGLSKKEYHKRFGDG